jgi:hypothetical protein
MRERENRLRTYAFSEFSEIQNGKENFLSFLTVRRREQSRPSVSSMIATTSICLGLGN